MVDMISAEIDPPEATLRPPSKLVHLLQLERAVKQDKCLPADTLIFDTEEMPDESDRSSSSNTGVCKKKTVGQIGGQ